MADKKISELSNAGALDGTELVPLVQGGATDKTTTQAIADLATPDTSGLVPYTGATADVNLDTYGLDAKFLNVKGTGGAGHLGLKHQSADATAGGGETVIFAGSDGEPRYKNDGGTVAQFASRAWVNLQGFITNVVTALGYTPENVANKENTTLDTSTTKYPTNNLVKTAVDAKVTANGAITGATKTKITYDSKGLVTGGADLSASDIPTIAQSQVTNLVTDLASKLSGVKLISGVSSSLTGTIAETVMITFTVAGNSFSATDLLAFDALVIKTGTASQLQFKLRINTSNTLVGSTVIATTTSATLANIYMGIRRTMFSIQGGSLFGFNFTTSNADDSVVSAVNTSSVAYDVTQTYYWILTCQLTNAGDSIKIQSAKLNNV